MTLRIACDERGAVTITDLRTGNVEVLTTGIVRQPVVKMLDEGTGLPGHMWSRLA